MVSRLISFTREGENEYAIEWFYPNFVNIRTDDHIFGQKLHRIQGAWYRNIFDHSIFTGRPELSLVTTKFVLDLADEGYSKLIAKEALDRMVPKLQIFSEFCKQLVLIEDIQRAIKLTAAEVYI